MFGITDITTYLIGVVIIVVLPGANSLFVLSVAAKRGVQMAYRATMGVIVGDFILMLLAVAGVASLLSAYPGLYVAMKFAGAAYLAYIGCDLLWSAWRRSSGLSEVASTEVVQTQSVSDPFRRGVLICLLNPKAILFFMSFFIQFVDRSYAYPALSFTILGVIVQLCSFIYLSALIFSGVRLARMLGHKPKLASGLSAGAGTLFLGFSAKLVSSAAN